MYVQDWILHAKYRIGRSDNGWIDNEHCFEWLSCSFVPQTATHNVSGKPILLIWDGHGSHCTSVLLLKAHEHNILILRLPPHCTHKLQPLDVGVFGPLQAKFADRTDEFVGKHHCGICKSDFVPCTWRLERKPSLLSSSIPHSDTVASILWIVISSKLRALLLAELAPSYPAHIFLILSLPHLHLLIRRVNNWRTGTMHQQATILMTLKLMTMWYRE